MFAICGCIANGTGQLCSVNGFDYRVFLFALLTLRFALKRPTLALRKGEAADSCRQWWVS